MFVDTDNSIPTVGGNRNYLLRKIILLRRFSGDGWRGIKATDWTDNAIFSNRFTLAPTSETLEIEDVY